MVIMSEFKAFYGKDLFLKPEKPFLLIYESKWDGISVAWMETEGDLLEVIEEVKGYGCEIIDAIEIGSCRDVNIDDVIGL